MRQDKKIIIFCFVEVIYYGNIMVVDNFLERHANSLYKHTSKARKGIYKSYHQKRENTQKSNHQLFATFNISRAKKNRLRIKAKPS